jgi:hypothetical protein
MTIFYLPPSVAGHHDVLVQMSGVDAAEEAQNYGNNQEFHCWKLLSERLASKRPWLALITERPYRVKEGNFFLF